MKEKEVIKELIELDQTLSDHEYKSWPYARLAVHNAIRLIESYNDRTICHCENAEFIERESGLKTCKNCGRC